MTRVLKKSLVSASSDAAEPKLAVEMPVTPKAKIAPKQVAKPAAKPVAKAAAKPVAKPTAKPATKAAVKAAAKPMVKQAPKPVAKSPMKSAPRVAKAATMEVSVKEVKVKSPKLVTNNFSMLESEYAILGDVKKACLALGLSVKKNQLLRVGLHLLGKADIENVKAMIVALPAEKVESSKSKKSKK